MSFSLLRTVHKMHTIISIYNSTRIPLRRQLFAGNFFCVFGILCILLVLNVVQASQLMIFIMVCSQYLIFTSIKCCVG